MRREHLSVAATCKTIPLFCVCLSMAALVMLFYTNADQYPFQ